jgi:hypothetical protein
MNTPWFQTPQDEHVYTLYRKDFLAMPVLDIDQIALLDYSIRALLN